MLQSPFCRRTAFETLERTAHVDVGIEAAEIRQNLDHPVTLQQETLEPIDAYAQNRLENRASRALAEEDLGVSSGIAHESDDSRYVETFTGLCANEFQRFDNPGIRSPQNRRRSTAKDADRAERHGRMLRSRMRHHTVQKLGRSIPALLVIGAVLQNRART